MSSEVPVCCLGLLIGGGSWLRHGILEKEAWGQGGGWRGALCFCEGLEGTGVSDQRLRGVDSVLSVHGGWTKVQQVGLELGFGKNLWVSRGPL